MSFRSLGAVAASVLERLQIVPQPGSPPNGSPVTPARTTIEARVLDVVAKVFERERVSITTDMDLIDDLIADDTDRYVLAIALEVAFRINVNDKDVLDAILVSDLIKLVQARLNSNMQGAA